MIFGAANADRKLKYYPKWDHFYISPITIAQFLGNSKRDFSLFRRLFHGFQCLCHVDLIQLEVHDEVHQQCGCEGQHSGNHLTDQPDLDGEGDHINAHIPHHYHMQEFASQQTDKDTHYR